ncbi:MAG: MnhB domain-containing protein [Bacillota bacterium]
MRESKVLKSMSKFIFPYIIIYGIYVTMYGNLTPGGGFQGGVIVATGVMLINFYKDVEFNLIKLSFYEKIVYLLILVFSTISYFTKGYSFTNFLTYNKTLFLVLLNFTIGLKVTLGLINIIETFLEEGDRLD